MIKLELEDIKTTKIGNNFMIQCDKFDVVFSPEALDELISDYESFKKDI